MSWESWPAQQQPAGSSRSRWHRQQERGQPQEGGTPPPGSTPPGIIPAQARIIPGHFMREDKGRIPTEVYSIRLDTCAHYQE